MRDFRSLVRSAIRHKYGNTYLPSEAVDGFIDNLIKEIESYEEKNFTIAIEYTKKILDKAGIKLLTDRINNRPHRSHDKDTAILTGGIHLDMGPISDIWFMISKIIDTKYNITIELYPKDGFQFGETKLVNINLQDPDITGQAKEINNKINELIYERNEKLRKIASSSNHYAKKWLANS